MKQLLLRVDESLHAHIAEQARLRGTSVNALANDVLLVALNPAAMTRKERLTLRLIAVGEVGRLRRTSAPTPSASSDEPLRGAGAIADDLINFERDRL